MQKEMTDEELAQAGQSLTTLLSKKEFKRVEEEFGYALRHGRPAHDAIKQDLERELKACDSFGPIDPERAEIRVSHFEPENDLGLKSLIECFVQVSERKGILFELVLNHGGLYLEDISNYNLNEKHNQPVRDNA